MLSVERQHRGEDESFVAPPMKKLKHDLTVEAAHSDRGSESAEELMRRRKRHVAAPQGTRLHFPDSSLLRVVQGDKQYVLDESGQRYLDTVSNVLHVGHCHEGVVAAAAAQMAELNTNSRFLNDRIVTYAQKLTATFPDKLNVCFFTNSGSEANDLALQIAEVVTGHTEIISLHGGYHGHLKSLRQISTHSFAKRPLLSLSKCTAPMPDVYRGKHQNPETAGELYAEEIQKIIEQQQAENKSFAAFIHESIPCCGGVILMPDGFLEASYRKVREAGGLCIADEVQSGFGRVGQHFWAFELQGVCPDIVTVGKPMGNGHPVGAVVTSREIADKFASSGVEYFNTFGGNPVSMAVSDAVLKAISEEQLQENAAKVGSFLLQELRKLQEKFTCVGDVRGAGLMIGVELVEDRETKEPATARTAEIMTRMLVDHHIIIAVDGIHDNVIKIKPPMCFSVENAKDLVSSLETVLRKTSF